MNEHLDRLTSTWAETREKKFFIEYRQDTLPPLPYSIPAPRTSCGEQIFLQQNGGVLVGGLLPAASPLCYTTTVLRVMSPAAAAKHLTVPGAWDYHPPKTRRP